MHEFKSFMEIESFFTLEGFDDFDLFGSIGSVLLEFELETNSYSL